MPTFAVLGFRPHTYWTAVAAVAGGPDAPRILVRRRLTFAGPDENFVYHRAAAGDPAAAAALIDRLRTATEANVKREIGALLDDLRRDGVTVRVAVTAAAVAKLPERLEDILSNHSRIHAAEGSFARDVIAAACAAAGLEVRRLVERELDALTGDLLGLGASAVAARLKAMGATLGPPWSEDYKLAVQAAWLHLREAEAAPA
ncbi:MAG: hypothetical protein JWP73_959 [Phenylobacterium sp.]|nr:hypothetical protein [Phenylobacterium sp.]